MRIAERPNYFFVVVVSTIFLIFFHPLLAFNYRALIDDQCYVQWLSQLLNFSFNECRDNFYFPGVSLMWTPSAIIAKWYAQMTNTDVLTSVTTAVGITSFGLFAICFFLFGDILRKLDFEKRSVALLVPLFILSVPILHYATARTTMTHAAEFFLSALTLWCLLKRKSLAAFIVGGMLCLVRINDAPVFLVLIARYLDERDGTKKLMLPALISTIVLLPVAYIGFVARYGGESSGVIQVLSKVSFSEFFRVNFDGPFGLAYAGSFWLMALFGGTFLAKHLSWVARASLIWMWLLYLICMGWQGMGNALGYRYLIGTYPFALLVWNELRKLRPSLFFKTGIALIVSNALWLTHLTWVYDHYSSWIEVANLKQAIHPVMRWVNYSVPSLSFQYLFQGKRSMEFMGPFVAELSAGQLRFTLVTFFVALSAVLFAGWKLLATKHVSFRKITSVCFPIVVFAYLIVLIAQQSSTLQWDIVLRYPILMISAISLSAINATSAFIGWFWLMNRNEKLLSGKMAYSLYSISTLSRYLPVGKFWQFATLIHFSESGKVKFESVISLIYSILIGSLVGASLGILGLSFTSAHVPLWIAMAVVLTLLSAVILLSNRAFVKFVFTLAKRKFQFDELPGPLTLPVLAKVFLLMLVFGWLSESVASLFLLSAVGISASFALFCKVTAAYAIASFAGYAAFITPGGLGVREAILVFIMKGEVGLPEAAFLAISLRLCTILADLIFVIPVLGRLRRHTAPTV